MGTKGGQAHQATRSTRVAGPSGRQSRCARWTAAPAPSRSYKDEVDTAPTAADAVGTCWRLLPAQRRIAGSLAEPDRARGLGGCRRVPPHPGSCTLYRDNGSARGKGTHATVLVGPCVRPVTGEQRVVQTPGLTGAAETERCGL